jgi:hypothetical protein
MIRRTLIVMLAAGSMAGVGAQTQTPPASPPQTTPVPKPFPGSNPNSSAPAKPSTPPPQSTPNKPAAPPQTPPAQPVSAQPASPAPAGAPTEASLGVKLFPDATFLESFDAGRGQRLYIFGTNAAYLEVAAFYKRELGGANELFKQPAMLQFDIPGMKFTKETMAYPPSVVVKDYTWTGTAGDLKAGYVFVDGTTERRYYTIIQIVPR